MVHSEYIANVSFKSKWIIFIVCLKMHGRFFFKYRISRQAIWESFKDFFKKIKVKYIYK